MKKAMADLWAQQGLIIPISGSRSIDEDFIAKLIAPVLAHLDVKAIAYDRWQFESLRKAFKRVGYEPPFLEDFGQGYKTMTPALKALEATLLAGQMRHGNHPVLTMCASSCRLVSDDAGNRKLTKRLVTGRIDGMVALAMAIGAGTLEREIARPREPTYQMFFVGGRGAKNLPPGWPF